MFDKERRHKFKVKRDIPLVRVLTAMDNNTLLRGREGSLCTDVPSSLRKKSGEETFPEGGGDVCTQARGGKAIILEASNYRIRVCLGHESFQIHQMSLEWYYLCFKSLLG